MDKINFAKKTGSLQAIKAVTAGLVVAYLLVALMESDFLWLFDFPYALILLFGVLLAYASGFIFGRIAGKFILVNKWPDMITGILFGFIIIWVSTFISSLPAFFVEGKSEAGEIFNYIGKPLGLVTVYGGIPILVTGLWFGNSITRKARKYSEENIQ